jgi:hypothetical protein
MPAKREDLTGKVFGRLTVDGFAGNTKQSKARWFCTCSCGNKLVVAATNLKSGRSKSCGCIQRHGKSQTPAYISWKNMWQRCTNPADPNYGLYGGAGVKVAERWEHFENFFEDLGPRPKGTSLGRYEDTGDYAPGNVAWMTDAQQKEEQRKKRALKKRT